MDDRDISAGLLVVCFPDEHGASRALRRHWHAREQHELSLDTACIVRRDRDGRMTYWAVRDLTPRTAEYYGGALGFALACLLLLPLVIEGDEIEAVPFDPAPGEGCRDKLMRVLAPGGSAVVFPIAGSDVPSRMELAARLGGEVTYVQPDPRSLDRLRRAIEHQWSPARSRVAASPRGIRH